MVKLVLLSLLLIVNLPSSSPDSAGCDKLSIETVITPVAGQRRSNVTFKIKGGVAPYTYVLFDKKHNLVSEDIKKNEFNGLAPGIYDCYVSDKEGCSRKVVVEVK